MTNNYYILLIISLFLFNPDISNAQSSDNYFIDSGIESGSNEEWGTWNNRIITEDTYQGSYAIAINSGTKGSISQAIELKSNATYKLSFYAKSSNVDEFAQVLVAHGSQKLVAEFYTPSHEEYTLFERTFTTGNLEEIIRISIFKNNAGFGDYKIDNISLVETNETAPQVRIWTLKNSDIPTVGLDYELKYSVIPASENIDEGVFTVENIEGTASIDNDNKLLGTSTGSVNVSVSFESNSEMNTTKEFVFASSSPKTYYVDIDGGNDTNNGTSTNSPWKSLDKVNAKHFYPGDRVYFKAGGIWEGRLLVNNRGTKEAPILFSKYGEGAKPVINANGDYSEAILIENAEYTHVTQFEVTNKGNVRGSIRYGVVLSANGEGDIHGTHVSHIDIHDVNGKLEKEEGGGGGILYKMGGLYLSRLVNAVIEENHIYDVERNGIYGKMAFGRTIFHKNLLIKNNLIERVPGDGIVAFGCEDAIIEHNLCREFTDALTDDGNNAAAGIWAFSSNRTIIQYNEVSGHQAHWDGQGFDSDFHCDSTIIQYNYSHDNAGGFILICSNGEITNGETANTNSIVRYNISINDGFRTTGKGANYCPAFHLAGPVEGTQIYNNTIYWNEKPETVKNELVDATEWGIGFPTGVVFKNNIFYSEEPSEFIFNEAELIFENNAYFGELDASFDESAITTDPNFVAISESNPDHYKLLEASSLIGNGVVIEKNGGEDYFGNDVSETAKPNLGAYNGDGIVEGARTDKPNVIVIMLDDLGYKDLGFNGCEDINTPNMDQLASGGANFTNAYVTYPVCGPSRAGFITGRYQQRFGFERNPQYDTNDEEMGLPQTEDTFADVMGTAGYHSTIIGKWHLGSTENLHPLNRGFDEFFGHLGGGHSYFTEEYQYQYPWEATTSGQSYSTWIQRGFEPVQLEGYLTHEFTNEAIDYVERNQDKPFFMFLSYNAPHEPLQAPQEYIDKYTDIEDENRRTYAAMVDVVDEGVGQLIDKLEELNLDDNTIVFLLSDNGGPESKNASDNGVLRGEKSAVYEGGYRVPFIMYWKGKITPQIYEKPVSSLDILSTSVAISDAEVAEERPLDGVNLLPYLSGENETTPHESIYVRKFDDDRFALRKGEHKLVIHNTRNPSVELFNLVDDISETQSIANDNPEIVEELQNELDSWVDQLIYPTFLGKIHIESKARQEIDFEKIENQTEVGVIVPLEVIASSYLPVSLEIIGGDATIEGNEVTVHSAGLITIKATQLGDENHEEAPTVTRTFMVGLNDVDQATYYVDATNGDDNNLGTEENPFSTLQRAIAVVNYIQSEGNTAQKTVYIKGAINTEDQILIPTGMNVKINGVSPQASIIEPLNERLFEVKGQLEITNITIQNAQSSEDGGVIKVNPSGIVRIEKSNFINNHAGNKGGVIFSQGDLKIKQSYFGENSSVGKGSAISATAGEVSIENTTFNSNYNLLKANGSVHFNSPNENSLLSVALVNNTFHDNYADGSALEGDEKAGGNSGILFEESNGHITIESLTNNLFMSQYKGAVNYNYGSDIQVWKVDFFKDKIEEGAIIKNNIATNITGSGAFPLDEASGNRILDKELLGFELLTANEQGLYYIPLSTKSLALNAGLNVENIATDILNNNRLGKFDVGAFEFSGGEEAIPVQVVLKEDTVGYTGEGLLPVLEVNTISDVVLSDIELFILFDDSEERPIELGDYTFWARPLNPLYEGEVTGVFTIDKTKVSYTVDQSSFIYNGEAQQPTVTSNLAIDFSIDLLEEEAILPGEYHLKVTANDENYIGDSTIVFTINKAELLITSLSTQAFIYDGESHGITYSIENDTEVAEVEVLYNASSELPVEIGEYTVSIRINDARYYGEKEVVLEILAPSGTVVFNIDNDTLIYNGEEQQPLITATPSVDFEVELLAVNEAILPGNYVVKVTSKDTNFTGEASFNYTITKAPLIITLEEFQEVTYSGLVQEITYSLENDITVDAVSVTYNDSTTSPINVGEYTVNLSIDDNLYYGNAEATFLINPAIVTFTIDSSDFIYNGVMQAPTIIAEPSVEYLVEYSQEETVLPGIYQMNIISGDSNYEGDTSFNYSISKAELLPIAIDNQEAVYNGEAQGINYSIDEDVSNIIITYNADTILPTEVGTYLVHIQVEDDRYYGEKEVIFTITQQEVSFTFDGNEFIYNGLDQRPEVRVTPSIPFEVELLDVSTSILPDTYQLRVTSLDNNHSGTSFYTYTIEKAAIGITLDQNQTFEYTGKVQEILFDISVDERLDSVEVTYNGSLEKPIEIGEYEVKITVIDHRYSGEASGTLIIEGVEPTSFTDNYLNVSIYPNPTKGNLTVESDRKGSIIIYNTIGQEVYQENVQSKAIIDLSSQKSGVYILMIQTETINKQFKFILKK